MTEPETRLRFALRLARMWAEPALTAGLLVFAAAVLFANVLPTRAATAATERRLAAQLAENRMLAARIRASNAEAERLEHDPWETERILRDELHMSGERELIVR